MWFVAGGRRGKALGAWSRYGGMDLVSGVVNLRMAETMGAVQMRVARKILDAQEMQGAAAVRLIEAATAGVSQAGDALVAAATGLGGNVDTYG